MLVIHKAKTEEDLIIRPNEWKLRVRKKIVSFLDRIENNQLIRMVKTRDLKGDFCILRKDKALLYIDKTALISKLKD